MNLEENDWLEVLKDSEYIVDSNRLSLDEYGCLIALSVASKSEDPHTKVGCCIVNPEGRIISTGYNGLKKGCRLPVSLTKEKFRVIKGKLFIHAETNALSLITKNEAKTIYLTHSPCASCSNNIATNEIKNVVFIKEYHRSQEYKYIFEFYKINYRKLEVNEIDRINEFIKQNMTIKI